MLLAVVQMTPNTTHRRLITPCVARKLTILLPTACEISRGPRCQGTRGTRGMGGLEVQLVLQVLRSPLPV